MLPAKKHREKLQFRPSGRHSPSSRSGRTIALEGAILWGASGAEIVSNSLRQAKSRPELPITYFAHKAANGELTISCRNRHCPKCQGSQAITWMEKRNAELLEVPYFHLVFTLPAEIGAIAYQNKAVIYSLLFKASSDTMLT